MITGYDPEEIVGKTNEFAAASIVSASLPVFAAAVERTMKGQAVDHVELQINKKDGNPAFVDMSAIPIMRNGVFYGAQVSMRDITERVMAEKNLSITEEKFATVFMRNPVSMTLVSVTDGVFF